MKHLMSILVLIILLANASKLYAQDGKKNRGLFNVTQIGVLQGFSTGNLDEGERVGKTSVRTTFGYFLHPQFSIGLGVGIDVYRNNLYAVAPLFLDVRGYLKDSRNTPYLFADLGGGLDAPGLYKGFMGNVGVGYKFFTSKKLCFVSSVGYNLQEVQGENTYVTRMKIIDGKAVNTTESLGNFRVHALRVCFGFLF